MTGFCWTMRLWVYVAVSSFLCSTSSASQPSAPTEKTAVMEYLQQTAFDPDALQIREISPMRSHTQKGGLLFKGWTIEYVCVTWNGKNRYGGYVGFSTDAFVIQNGRVVNVLDKGEYYPGRYLCP